MTRDRRLRAASDKSLHLNRNPAQAGLAPTAPSGPARVMGTKSRDRLYGTSVRMAVERAVEARKQADKLACEAWTKRMLAFKGPAQPSPTLGDALNAGCAYLEVRCLGRDTHQTVALDIARHLRRRRSTSWSATCVAKIVLKCTAIRASGAIWLRFNAPTADGPDRPSRSKLFLGSGSMCSTIRTTSRQSAPAASAA